MGRKPRGYQGSITLRGDGAGAIQNPITLPNSQDEIEALVVQKFDQHLDRSTRDRFSITGFTPIPGTETLDCWVHSARGDWMMDCVELVPVQRDSRGHDAAPNVYNVGHMADRMVEQIWAKAQHYRVKPDPWLLMYSTAWQFMPTSRVFSLVKRALMGARPPLERVYFIDITCDDSSAIELLNPIRAHELREIYEANQTELRGCSEAIADNRQVQMTRNDDGTTTYMIPLGRVPFPIQGD